MLEESVTRIVGIWKMGGWTMIPLCGLSLVIYWLAVRLLMSLSKAPCRGVSDEQMRRWVSQPDTAPAEVGEMIRYSQDGARSLDDVHRRFSEIISARIPTVERRLVFLNILVTAAPLLGLLGTVMGMLMTFKALAVGGGKLTEQMSAGISAALFPPEVGLCVALPGLILIQLIRRKRQEYEAFLVRLESCAIQRTRKQLQQSRRAAGPAQARKAAPAPRLNSMPQHQTQ